VELFDLLLSRSDELVVRGRLALEIDAGEVGRQGREGRVEIGIARVEGGRAVEFIVGGYRLGRGIRHGVGARDEGHHERREDKEECALRQHGLGLSFEWNIGNARDSRWPRR
jgi:hypothetical protein